MDENAYDGDDPEMTISWDESIVMADGTRLSANIYRPTGDARVPAIVTMGPYGKDLPMSVTYPQLWARLVREHPDVLGRGSGRYLVWELPDPQRWVPHGYAVLHLDARGTGRSRGFWSPMSPREATDFAAAVEWAAGRSWCSGKVGVLGVSYHAMAAWRVAEQQPPHLSAIIPWYGAGDTFREAWRHGGILSNTFIDAWWYRWVRNQYGDPHGCHSSPSGRISTGDEHLSDAERERARADIPAQTREHHLFDDWAADQAVDWSRITVPMLSVAGLGTVGLHLRGNVEAFRHAASSAKWLMLLQSQAPGIDRFYGDQGFDVQQSFFDHYLKNMDNDWSLRPRVDCELRQPDGALSRRTADAWPPAGVHWMTLTLDTTARTMNTAEVTVPGRAEFWPTSDGVAFTSEAFPDGAAIIGPSALRLHLSTTASDVDIFASLTALDADGAVLGPVARGWLRLSHRELDEQASSPAQPVLSHRRIADVVPHQRYGVDVEMWPASAAVPPGGALMLTIRGIDEDSTGQFRHNDPNDRPSASFAGWTTLISEPAHPSSLLLPVHPHE